jgi:hypothetical protein
MQDVFDDNAREAEKNVVKHRSLSTAFRRLKTQIASMTVVIYVGRL